VKIGSSVDPNRRGGMEKFAGPYPVAAESEGLLGNYGVVEQFDKSGYIDRIYR